MILKNLMKITNNHHKQTPFRHRSLCLKLWIIKKQLMSLSKFKIIVPKKKTNKLHTVLSFFGLY